MLSATWPRWGAASLLVALLVSGAGPTRAQTPSAPDALPGWSGPLPVRWRDDLSAGRAWLVGAERQGGGGALHLVLQRADGVRVGVPVTDCRTAAEAIQMRSPERTVQAGGYEVTLRGGWVGAGGRALWSLAERLCDPPPTEPHDFLYVEVTVVSMVGPLLTLSFLESEAGAGGPPYHTESWRTLDVRTGAEVPLLDVLEEPSLLAAVRADPYVQRSFGHARGELAAATQWGELRAVLTRGATYTGFTSFGIADYDPRTHEASVRLAFLEDPCGLCPNRVRTLGLRVVVRPAWRPHFVEAHRGSGRFVGPRSP